MRINSFIFVLILERGIYGVASASLRPSSVKGDAHDKKRKLISYYDRKEPLKQIIDKTFTKIRYDRENVPTEKPSSTESSVSSMPSKLPSTNPSENVQPSRFPSTTPSFSAKPSTVPSSGPSLSIEPTKVPSEHPTIEISKKPSKNPTKEPTQQPTSEPTYAPSEVPTEEITNEPTQEPTRAPTKTPTQLPDLKYVGNNGAPINNFPLKLCEGDCDNDGECAGTLVCMQRNGGEDVPGCKGFDSSLNDYCIEDESLMKAPSAAPTKEVPTKSPRPTNEPSTLPTMAPTKLSLIRVGNNGSPSSVFPLGMCQGDCDNDEECGGRLICIERRGGEDVPGCAGFDSGGTDYCTDPELLRDNIGVPRNSPDYKFQIRLFWSKEYFWQETTKETWWCMECTKCDEFSLGDGPNHGCITKPSCSDGDNIWIRKCFGHNRNHKFNVVRNSGTGDQIRVDGTNLCFSTVNNNYLELRPCDRNNSRQLWKRIGDLNRFELRPYHQRDWNWKQAKCITQLHHPKDKELVGLHQCRVAHVHETGFWEEYDRY